MNEIIVNLEPGGVDLTTLDIISRAVTRVFDSYHYPRVLPELGNLLSMVRGCEIKHMTDEVVEIIITIVGDLSRFVHKREYDFPEYHTSITVTDNQIHISTFKVG